MMVIDPATGIGPNREILGRVEVPRYSQPSADGVELDRDKRLALAVARVLERDDTVVRNGHGKEIPPEKMVGWSFCVLTEIDGEIEHVHYEQNPAFDGVWNPEEDREAES